ncbi:thioredoxin-like protein [Elsinoe ampelina]|uniref:Thioredoxin-like protein n=1 Tax=Elsinoe ampelina TaxID=302913 RepID=A0A6A6GA64_9PEZI|nr:thioredoxin-like protein [Elsinoe ampelina]
MALAPKFAGHKLVAGLSPKTVHTLELYLDYVCPFSKKMFNTVYTSVLPLVEQKYQAKVQIIFRQQIQPWHPSSTLTHEAGVAVLQTNPDKFWDFSKALFDKQADYFDVNVVNETRNQTYKRLAKLAAGVGLDEGKIYKQLEISDKPGEDGSLNTGNATTNDLKLLIKAARLIGIHVSPTVVFNGIVENSISSGFTAEQWDEWLSKNVT